MDSYPFTDVEWAPVKEAALSILNAHLAEDESLWASLRLDLVAPDSKIGAGGTVVVSLHVGNNIPSPEFSTWDNRSRHLVNRYLRGH